MILVISPKSVYVAKRLKAEGKKAKAAFRILDMRQLVALKFKVDVTKYSCLYIRNPYLNGSPKYLPLVVKLAKQFKAAGKKVIDANIAHEFLGQGKWMDYQKLIKAGLPIPKTCIVHGRALYKYKFPFVLKWIYGFKARNVFFVRNQDQLDKLLPLRPKLEWLAQEFIKADFEYKVITVGYKALPVVLRFGINADGFRADFGQSKIIRWRHSERVQPSEESQTNKEILRPSDALRAQDDAVERVIALAQRASGSLGRELAKVDIIQKGKRLYILEVNRFPGLDSFEKLTKFNVIKRFVEYLQ